MNAPIKMDVTRKVVVEEFTDDDGCGLTPLGWYWRYEGEKLVSGPYRTMDEAMSAATRGVECREGDL